MQIQVRQLIRLMRIREGGGAAPDPVAIRLLLRWDDNGVALVPATGDTESGFYGALVQLFIEAGRHLQDCRASNCERIFVAKRIGQLYRSLRCQNRATGARFRAGK